jgi:hypothetical protein
MHEKTIAQSRDRQGADPLADARGSVHTFIFGTVVHAPSAHPRRMKIEKYEMQPRSGGLILARPFKAGNCGNKKNASHSDA